MIVCSAIGMSCIGAKNCVTPEDTHCSVRVVPCGVLYCGDPEGMFLVCHHTLMSSLVYRRVSKLHWQKHTPKHRIGRHFYDLYLRNVFFIFLEAKYMTGRCKTCVNICKHSVDLQ